MFYITLALLSPFSICEGGKKKKLRSEKLKERKQTNKHEYKRNRKKKQRKKRNDGKRTREIKTELSQHLATVHTN